VLVSFTWRIVRYQVQTPGPADGGSVDAVVGGPPIALEKLPFPSTAEAIRAPVWSTMATLAPGPMSLNAPAPEHDALPAGAACARATSKLPNPLTVTKTLKLWVWGFRTETSSRTTTRTAGAVASETRSQVRRRGRESAASPDGPSCAGVRAAGRSLATSTLLFTEDPRAGCAFVARSPTHKSRCKCRSRTLSEASCWNGRSG